MSEVEIVRLNEIAEIRHGFAFQSEYFRSEPTEYILLTPGNFHVDQRLYFGSNTKYYEGEIPNDYVLRNGDLLVVMTDLTKDMNILGNAVILQSNKKVLHNQRIGKVIISHPEKVEQHFLMYLMNSPIVRNNVKATASGTTVRHTSPTRMLDVTIPLPPLPEQRKIAQILGTWDEAIATTEKLIAALERRKQGLMQRLLTGQVRFEEFGGSEWKSLKIGKLLKEVSRPVEWDDTQAYELLSIRRRSGGIFLREVRRGSDIATKQMNVAYEGDFLISKMQVVHGASALTTREYHGKHISNSYIALVVRDAREFDIRFFDWLSKTRRLYRIAFVSSNGVHIEKMSFNLKDYLDHSVRIPPNRKEQERIVETLQAAQNEIDRLSDYKEAVMTQKKGLMQRLLTGQVRVTV